MAVDPVERVRLELVTRRLSIMMLGVLTVLVGGVMMMTGAPAFIEDWFSPWSRMVLGILAFLPGLMVAIGGIFDDRHPCAWWLHMLGLGGIAAWFAFMCGAYTVLVFQQGIAFAQVGQSLTSEQAGRAYVPLVYLVLFFLALIPLVTMIRVGRPGR